MPGLWTRWCVRFLRGVLPELSRKRVCREWPIPGPWRWPGVTGSEIRVVPLIGPSSIILAVMASGLNGQSFAFNGYLPVKPPERARAIRTLERRATGERQSQVFIEAPYRNAKLLGQLLEVCAPDTRLTLAVDITSPQEYIRTLTVREWRSALLPEMDKRPAIFILG